MVAISRYGENCCEYGHFSTLSSQFIIGCAKDEQWTSVECGGIKSRVSERRVCAVALAKTRCAMFW